jgi:hypothetical protein
MKTQIMTAVVMMSLLGGCGENDSNAISDLRAAKIGKSYIAIVKKPDQSKDCAAKVRSIAGVKLDQVLPTTGVISFTASKTARDSVAKLSCISAVEEAQSAGINPPTDTVAYNAMIKGSTDIAAATKACAKKIESIIGVTVTEVLTFVGVVSFNASPSASQKVQKLNCVMTVEKDLENHANPSTRIGN